MLRVENLKAGSLPALTFEVAAGECLAVEAPSGGGKTRLLRAIADLDPAPGQVFLDGAERSEMPAPAWRKLIRYCAPEPAWWTGTPRGAFSRDAESVRRRTRLLPALGLDAALLDRPISQCSTGERQRLALARALQDGPRVLLLDEPTAALDPVSAGLVAEEIRYQMLTGCACVLVSHAAAEVKQLANARLQLQAPRPAPAPGPTTADWSRAAVGWFAPADAAAGPPHKRLLP